MNVDKRYQVFVSSTFVDLRDERQAVAKTLLEIDCIPAGMEIFPAADEDQLQFIKSIIDDCDYYLLIVGGRYGTVDSEGVSYTEREFDYAVKKGLPVIALLHGKPTEIPLGKSEPDPGTRAKLANFIAKASTGRLVKHWELGSDLPGLVMQGLIHAIKRYPAVGWVRGSILVGAPTAQQMLELERENKRLREQLATGEGQGDKYAQLAQREDKLEVVFVNHTGGPADEAAPTRSLEVSWNEILILCSNFLHGQQHMGLGEFRSKLAEYVLQQGNIRGVLTNPTGMTWGLLPESIQLVERQLIALGYVSVDRPNTDLARIIFTQRGSETVSQLLAIRRT